MALFNILIMPLNLFLWVLNGLLSVQVFTSMALFNILIMPINLFPWVLNGLLSVQVFTSMALFNILIMPHKPLPVGPEWTALCAGVHQYGPV